MASSAFALDAADSRILYFEPLRLATPAPSVPDSPVQEKTSRNRELQFDAYGRRFVLTLEPNDNLAPLQTEPNGIELYRGQVNGVAGSWARISMLAGEIQGMLWDGADLYVIEQLNRLRDALPAHTKVDTETTAIFRLADVTMTPGAATCGADASADLTKGADAYGLMLNELKGSAVMMQAVTGPTRRLEISALGDTLLLDRFGSETRARNEILQRLNNVDGIYSSQLGVQITVGSIDFGDSLSASTAASSLLNELGDLRRRSPSLYMRGLTHLFTGRDLEGTTVGIAFINSVCDRRYGAGLTQARNGSVWTESLIAAHEIGHNFGAPHDGAPDGACASTPTGAFLMSPSINGNDTFSSCSLGIMRPKAASASCITPLGNADIALDADLGSALHRLNTSFDWQVTVRNIGGLATAGATAKIDLPAALTVEEAFVSGGTCTSGAGVVNCELGEIAGGTSTPIQLVLRSLVAASHPITVTVGATNDGNIGNNQGSGTISTQPEVDLAASLQAPASNVAGTAFNVALTVTNRSEIRADSVTFTLSLPAAVTASEATFGDGMCTLGAGSVTCSLPSLAAGAIVTGTATLTASTAGAVALKGRVASGQIDPVASNDTDEATVNVASAAWPVSQSSTSGGGGGSPNPSLLALLLAALGLKSFQRRPLQR